MNTLEDRLRAVLPADEYDGGVVDYAVAIERLAAFVREELTRPTETQAAAPGRLWFQADSVELERLQRWVDDLQSGLYINCVYCGHRYGPRETMAATLAEAKAPSMRQVLEEHVATCPEHPMAKDRRNLRAALAYSEARMPDDPGRAYNELSRVAKEVVGWIEPDEAT